MNEVLILFDKVQDLNNNDQVARDPILYLTLKIDATIKKIVYDDWRGNRGKENIIKRLILL